MDQNILKGAIDLHLHSSPDIVARSVGDLDMAQEAAENGMAGFVLKNHYAPTAGRAAVIRRLYHQLNAVGSITLDSGVGASTPWQWKPWLVWEEKWSGSPRLTPISSWTSP